MSSLPTIEPFKGTNWEECNHFIRAIRAAAWKEGKFRDVAWVADFAALHFSQKALKWHSRLPQDVREDWAKLQVALLDRWSPPEDDDEPPIEPTPAAAPSLNRNEKADRPLEGALKVAIDGSDTNSYFNVNSGGFGLVTNNANEALRFRCSSISNTTILQRTDGSFHYCLGINWRTTNPNLKNGSVAYGYLVLVDPISLKTSWGAGYSHRLASCTVSANGEVIPFWEREDTTKITIGIFCNGGALYVAADPSAYSAKYSGQDRVKLFITSID